MLTCFSCVWLFVTLWTIARQAPLSMGCSRQEHWSGLLCPPPGDLPDQGILPVSLTSPALADRFFTLVPSGKPRVWINHFYFPFLKIYLPALVLHCSMGVYLFSSSSSFFFFSCKCRFFSCSIQAHNCNMSDLSSLTRDWIWAPCVGVRSLNLWITREVPKLLLF